MENNFRNKDSVFTLCILQMENNFENRESANTLIILKMENNFENEESVSTHSIHMYGEIDLHLRISVLHFENWFTILCVLQFLTSPFGEMIRGTLVLQKYSLVLIYSPCLELTEFP